MFLLCVIAGLMVGLSLGWAVKVNVNNCPLYAHIWIKPNTENNTIELDQVRDPCMHVTAVVHRDKVLHVKSKFGNRIV